MYFYINVYSDMCIIHIYTYIHIYLSSLRIWVPSTYLPIISLFMYVCMLYYLCVYLYKCDYTMCIYIYTCALRIWAPSTYLQMISVFMYVCMYECVCMWNIIYIYIHIHAHIYMFTNNFLVYACMVCVRKFMQISYYKYINTCINMHIHTYMHIYIYTHTHKHIHNPCIILSLPGNWTPVHITQTYSAYVYTYIHIHNTLHYPVPPRKLDASSHHSDV
jgi:hypothetical protein